jgi:hypothetical protein
MKKILSLLILALGVLSLNGCLYAAAAGVGAAAGYHANKEGYRVQSPVTKE